MSSNAPCCYGNDSYVKKHIFQLIVPKFVSLFLILVFFPGILSSLAVLYSKLGQEDKSTKCLSKLLSLSDNVCGGDPSLPDEVLYGRAGYLFSLLFVQKHLGAEKISYDVINQVSKVPLST